MAFPVLRLLTEVQFEVDEAAEVEDEVEERLEIAGERLNMVPPSEGRGDAEGCCGSGLAWEGIVGVLVAS